VAPAAKFVTLKSTLVNAAGAPDGLTTSVEVAFTVKAVEAVKNTSSVTVIV